MKGRLFTFPRLIFLVLFGYINYTVSMRYAYHQYLPFKPIDFFHLFICILGAAFYLFIGISFGKAVMDHLYSEESKDEIAGLIGILLAIIIGILLNLLIMLD